MIALLRTLSLAAFRRQSLQMALAFLGIAAGVATFSSLRAAQEALVTGLTATIGDLAGTADLQVTGVGGVPESLADRILPLSGVRGVAPVIEEVIALEPAEHGNVLLIGVDLVGDRGMRAYSFEGADADVDDPLVFLAQPNSVAVSRALADRLHLQKGSPLTVRVRSIVKRLVVRAVLGSGPLSRAFGGAVVVTDVYAAQDLLGRGRRFDRLDVSANQGIETDGLRTIILSAVGAGYRVDTPASRGQSLRALIRHYDASFTASRILAVVIAGFLIFNVFSVAVERRRREIGILRTLGATSFQIQTLLLTEALVLGCIGGAAGLFLGWLVAAEGLAIMRESVGQLYRLTTLAEPVMSARLAVESIGLGMLAAIGGAWAPTRAACRIPAVEALSAGAFASRRASVTRGQIVVVVVAVVIAAIAFAWPAEDETLFLFLTLVPTGVVLAVLARPLAEVLLAWSARMLSHASPVSARVAVDALRSQPRRTATATAGMVLALVFALGIGGHLRALSVTFSDWIDRTYDADLYVRASSGFAPSTVRVPWALGDELERIPGVRSASGLRYDIVMRQGQEVMLAAADVPLMRQWLRRDLTEGSPDLSDVNLDTDACIISDNLARRQRVHAGDRLTLDTPAGPATFVVGAVVNLLLSEYGVVVVNRRVFDRYWQDDRVDLFRVTLDTGADAAAVTRAITERVAGSHPVLISTRADIVADARRAIDSFVVFTRVTALMAAAVAFINVATALLISVTQRKRELAILKALGAVKRQIVGIVLAEAIIMTMGGLAIAAPLGAPLAWFFTRVIMETYFGFHVRPMYAYDLLLVLALTLPVVAALAAWLPARQATGVQPLRALGHD